MKTIVMGTLALAITTISLTASAGWTSSVGVNRVVVGSDTVDIWFDGELGDAACTNKSRASFDVTSIPSQERRDRLVQIATTALFGVARKKWTVA